MVKEVEFNELKSIIWCRNFSLGLVTKGSQECRPREEPESVGECENEHSHSQMNFHFGSWTPSGLPKV
jgi:hypothetical protein